MAPLIIRYNLDPTGSDPNNLVLGEQHTLSGRTVRAIAPTYGAYFVDSLVITDLTTNQPLVRDVQWYPGEMYEVPTAKYGKDVFALIIITDTTVSNNVSIQYQAIGGEYSTPDQAIVDMLNNLNIDNRPIAWQDIIHKPSAFPPSMHLHDAGDVYGFEYVVHALERLRNAVELGDQVSHDLIYKYIDLKVGTLASSATVGQLTTETNNRIAADNALNTLIAANTTAIANEVTRATTAENAMTATIATAVANSNKLQPLTDAASIVWDLNVGNSANITIAGNRAIAAPINMKVGTFILEITQDAVGGRTVTWDPVFKFPAGVKPVLSTAANAVDLFSFYCNGTTMYGSYVRGLA